MTLWLDDSRMALDRFIAGGKARESPQHEAPLAYRVASARIDHQFSGAVESDDSGSRYAVMFIMTAGKTLVSVMAVQPLSTVPAPQLVEVLQTRRIAR